jgi:hypothetical protein
MNAKHDCLADNSIYLINKVRRAGGGLSNGKSFIMMEKLQ